MITKAVILAGGLGTRMQKADSAVSLDSDASAMADAGNKPMVPVEGKPFVEHSLRELDQAGLTDVCLVVGPGSDAIREYLTRQAALPGSVRISFVVQPEPLGTANALLPAHEFTGSDEFVMLNGDNVYAGPTLSLLTALERPRWALIGFERQALIEKSNIEAERIKRFAVLDLDGAGQLRRIVEKAPNPDEFARDGQLYVSMNCFRFGERIYEACASIEPNPVRGEYELPDAVQYGIEQLGLRPQVVPAHAGVVDLTHRRDVETAIQLIKEGAHR